MSDLARVSVLGEQLIAKQTELAEAEEKVKELKDIVTRIEREDLPALMAEVGLQEVRLMSGQLISIKEEVNASISAANRSAAHAWLLANGFGGIIKTGVTVIFGKGEHEDAEKIASELQNRYNDHEVDLDESVHPSTLKAFVKERMKAGDSLPLDLFGVYVYSKAVVK